jgi:hypothetical protein
VPSRAALAKEASGRAAVEVSYVMHRNDEAFLPLAKGEDKRTFIWDTTWSWF